MKHLAKLFAIFAMLALVGCATAGGSSSGGTTSASKSSGKMLTDEDYKRLGIKETHSYAN